MADVTLVSRVRGPGEMAVATDAVWTRISGRIDARLRLVERVAVTLLDRALVDGEVHDAVKESEVLAQWLGVLQLSGAATLCRQLVAVLKEDDLDAASGLQLAGLVDDLRAVIHAASVETSAVSTEAARVRVISPISVELDSLMWLLSRRGLRVEHDTSLSGNLDGVDALLTTSQPSPTLTYTTLALGRERSEAMQRIVLHADEPIDVQCQLARVADLLLSAASPADVLADEVQRFVLGGRREPDVVTVLGGSDLAEVLKRYGIRAEATNTVQDAVDSMERGSRTLLIGSRTPGTMAAGLVGLVRARPHLRDVVIAVSGFDEITDRILRRAGVDLVIGRDTDPDAWAVHLKALRERRRRDADIVGDPAAAVLPWPRASVLLERALIVSRRLESHAALAIIEFDRMGADGGPAGGDGVTDALATEFRLDDIVGRWDESRIVVLLRGAGRRAAVARLAGALKRLDLEDGARAAVVEFPIDGATLGDLLEAGTSVIATAREADGPIVASTDWAPTSEKAPDIVLVEADASLAGILESIFERRGHSTHHIASGAEALRYFTGSDPQPPPKLLILEMDAPGADGLMVLRALRRSGLMGRLRVLLTCARVREGELQEAYELGALDVVEKPYSAVVLTQRVKRLLET